MCCRTDLRPATLVGSSTAKRSLVLKRPPTALFFTIGLWPVSRPFISLTIQMSLDIVGATNSVKVRGEFFLTRPKCLKTNVGTAATLSGLRCARDRRVGRR
jgi:hypothetical protein